MFLYPQLLPDSANKLASTRRTLPEKEVEGLVHYEHEDTVWTPTGGSRVRPESLKGLRNAILDATETIRKIDTSEDGKRAIFDQEVARILLTEMEVSPNEASRPGVWDFVSCVLLCDLIRWRFPGTGEGTSIDRFRSGRRNTFERLWWRAFVLYDSDSSNPFNLIYQLGEDELVQIMERPTTAGSPALARTVARTLITISESEAVPARRVLIREAQKRLMRLSAFVRFDGIPQDQLHDIVAEMFSKAIVSQRVQ